MALNSTLSIGASAQLTSALDLTTPSTTLTFARSVSLASGTGAGKADVMFTDRRTLAASATEDLDLAGALLNDLGGAAIFARVKGLIISANAANTNDVVVGAAASNAWAALLNATGTVTLRPGATFCALAGAADATGWAVTAGTGDLLTVTNSAGSTSVTYDIVVIGNSA